MSESGKNSNTDSKETPEAHVETNGNAGSVARPRAIRVADKYRDLIFTFELGEAILKQLLDKFDQFPSQPLTPKVDAPYPGFYQLILGDQVVYTGKTSRAIRTRLAEHYRKLQHRIGIDLSVMKCRFAFVEDPSLVDLSESALIGIASETGYGEWNTTGFGSKVSGHRRGDQDASEWDKNYPADLTAVVTAGSVEKMTLEKLYQQLQAHSPITLSIPRRFLQQFRTVHSSDLFVPEREMPIQEWLDFLASQLSENWRISKKPQGFYIVPRAT